MICKTFKLTWIWTCKIPVMHDFLLQTLTLAERKQSESVVLSLGQLCARNYKQANVRLAWMVPGQDSMGFARKILKHS